MSLIFEVNGQVLIEALDRVCQLLFILNGAMFGDACCQKMLCKGKAADLKGYIGQHVRPKRVMLYVD